MADTTQGAGSVQDTLNKGKGKATDPPTADVMETEDSSSEEELDEVRVDQHLT